MLRGMRIKNLNYISHETGLSWISTMSDTASNAELAWAFLIKRNYRIREDILVLSNVRRLCSFRLSQHCCEELSQQTILVLILILTNHFALNRLPQPPWNKLMPKSNVIQQPRRNCHDFRRMVLEERKTYLTYWQLTTRPVKIYSWNGEWRRIDCHLLEQASQSHCKRVHDTGRSLQSSSCFAIFSSAPCASTLDQP